MPGYGYAFLHMNHFFLYVQKKGFQDFGEFNFLRSAGRLAGSPEGSLFGLKWRKTRTRMQIVIILEGPAGRPGRVAEPAVGQVAGGTKEPLLIPRGGKRCTRMQNVLISEVPPAAAGRGGPEMIFSVRMISFCTYRKK